MRPDDAATRDLVAWRTRRDTRRLAAARTAPGSELISASRDALDEHLRDTLRRDAVAAACARAREAPASRAGESGRAQLRLLAEPYLESAAREETLELARSEREHTAQDGFKLSLAQQQDPLDRFRVARRWERAEEALARKRLARRDALDAAAREVGAPSRAGLNGLTMPIPPESIAAATTRTVIDALDAAVGAAAAERRARFRPRLPEEPDSSDAVLFAALTDHRDAIDARGIARRLRVLARALDLDVDSKGPALLHDLRGIDEATAFEWVEPRPALWPGPWEGPAGLAGGLEALGRAARATVLRRTRGESGLACADPAFACAAGALLRRLVLGRAFWEWAEVEASAELLDTVRFEEVVRIRLAWARTELGLKGLSGPEPEVVDVLARAAGRAPSPDLIAVTWEADGGDAAILRGAQLAVLIEERLRTRWGHLWFREDRSPRFLREVWDAEEGETAESVADALDLGTMEPSLLSDGYRI